MPKYLFKKIKMPKEQPDCCAECPLLGLIPKNEMPKGCRETRVCLMTGDAMTAPFSRSRKSTKDTHHPLKRPCDHNWELYQKTPFNGWYNLRVVDWHLYRVPLEETRVLKIKFHH